VPDTQAIFTEVLEITADLNAFKASLDQVKAAYLEFINGLGESAVNFGNIAGIEELKAQITEVLDVVQTLSGSALQAANESASQASEAFQKLDALAAHFSENESARTAKDVEQKVAGVEKVAEAQAVASNAKAVAAARAIEIEQEGVLNQHAVDSGAAESKAIASARAIDIEQEGILNKHALDEDAANAKILASAEALAAKRLALTKEIDLEQQGLADQQAVRDEAAGAKAIQTAELVAAKRLALTKEIALEQQALEDQQAVRDEEAAARSIALAEKLRLTRVRPGESVDAANEQALAIEAKLAAARAASTAKRVEEEAEVAAAAEAGSAKQAAAEDALNAKRIRNNEERITAAHEAAIAEEEAKNSANDHVAKLGAMALKLAEVYVIWTAISTVIGLVAEVIKTPFVALQDGIKYLDTINEDAVNLEGNLARNVIFAKDLADNFLQASAAAKEVTIAIRDASVASGVPVATLQKTFDALLNSGAINSVKSLKELVDLATLLDLAMKGTGKGIETMRSLSSQLPLVFQGTLKPTAAMAEALGLSGEALADIIAKSKIHKDLLEELQGPLGNYVKQIADAAQTHKNIIDRLDEEKGRFEAIFADPVYSRLTELMKQLLDYIEANRAKLLAVAGAAGEVALGFEKALEALLKTAQPGEAILKQILLWAAATEKWLNYLTLAAPVLVDLAKVANREPSGFFDLKKDLPSIADIQKIGEEAKKVAADINAAFSVPSGPVPPNPSSLLNKTGLNGPPKPDLNKPTNNNEQLRLDKDELEEALSEIKAKYEEYRNTVKLSVDDGAESKTGAAAKIKTANDAEIAAITFVIRAYENQATALAKTEAQKDEIRSRSEKELNNIVKGLGDNTSAAERAAALEQTAILKTQLDARLAVQKAYADNQLTYNKALYSAGYFTELEFLKLQSDAEKAAYQERSNRLTEQLGKAAPGSERRAQIQKQLDEDKARAENQADLNDQVAIEAELRASAADRARVVSIKQVTEQLQLLDARLNDLATNSNNSIQLGFNIKASDIADAVRLTEADLAAAKAKNDHTDAVHKLTLALADLHTKQVQNLEDNLKAIASSNNPTVVKRQAQRQVGGEFLAQQFDAGPQTNAAGITETAAEFNTRIKALSESLQGFQNTFDNAFTSFEKQLFGFDISTAMDNATTATDKFAVGVQAGANALTKIVGAVAAVQGGVKQGGALGGISAGIGQFSDALSSIPVVGQFIPAIGQVLGVIGGLFVAQTKRIAEDIKKTLQTSEDAFSNGSATLAATITTITAQREQAISQLSGKKGGQDQLNTLLPEFDKEIATLKAQQLQIKTDFESALSALQLQSDTLASVNQQWTAINKQVKDYIDAGGDAANAAAFLSLNLQKIQQTAQTALDQGEQTGIQDAITLNGLLVQRNQLVTDYNQKVFDLVNQDAIERRQAGAVTRAQQIAALTAQQATDLANIDQQITLTTQKVTLESQVYTIASDINQLHRDDDALTIKALATQISMLQDYQKIVKDISVGATGQFQSAGLFISGGVNITVTAPAGVDPNTFGAGVADGFSQELARQQRLVPSF
jgi:hypothetical protein